ncbi:hypothetical protein GCM10023210_37800 [Chryseobacterium ginsengisoli]|uniref:Uncharacterized protein n=1 Tax=Chryseobacterium ginsengisoli TaxID=363853 RepID=A0ABP9MSH6_9FLAO
MITTEQESQISLYLSSKKLDSQLFFEVKDHFILQISEIIKDNISFQEAFLETKLSWAKELEMVKADLFSFRKIAKIEKEIIQRRFRKMMIIAFLCSLIMVAVFNLNENVYLCLQGSFIVLHLGFVLYNFIFGKMKFTEYRQMSFHPLLLRNLLLLLIVIPASNMLFSTREGFWEFPANHIFITYAVIIQIQLLYFRIKKINVLLA